MDRAYEGDETRQLALDLGFIPIVPPKSNRLEPWNTIAKYTSAEMKSNDCFVGLKGSVASSFDKLDVIITAFIQCALVVGAIR